MNTMAACLRKHGVTIPTSGAASTPPGYDAVKTQKALQACLRALRGRSTPASPR